MYKYLDQIIILDDQALPILKKMKLSSTIFRRKRTVLRMEVKEVDRIKKDGNCCVRIHSGRFYRGTKKQFFGPGGYEFAPDFKNIRSLKVDNCLEFDEYNAENS